MLLTISERMGVLSILPQQGNFATMKILTKLRDDLGFDESEVAAANISQVGDQTHWDPQKAIEKEIEIGDTARGIIVAGLKALDDKGQITALTMSLYERFIANGEE